MMLYVPPTNGRKIRWAFLHCDAWANKEVLGLVRIVAINSWHKKRRFRSGDPATPLIRNLFGPMLHFGYTDYIDPKARFFNVRSADVIPQAQSGYNSGSVALCVAGLHKSDFTEAQLEKVVQWCHEVREAHPGVLFGGGGLTVHGHKEVAAKACPVFDYVRLLGIKDPGIYGGHMGSEKPGREFDREDIGSNGLPILSLTSFGPEVKKLQTMLNSVPDIPHWRKLEVDGAFGQLTNRTVHWFQRSRNIQDDGVVGPITWAELEEALAE